MDLKNIDLKNIKLDELISKVKTIEKKVLIKNKNRYGVIKKFSRYLH